MYVVNKLYFVEGCIMEERYIKIMSFNIRNGGEGDGINGISKRHFVIEKMIKRENPDIIGFQEINSNERRWVRSILGTGYALVGGGRDENYRGEGCSMAFKTDIMELVKMDTLWLSDTPEVSGSRYCGIDQSPFPRLLHSLTLKHKEASRTITVINTHLDHMGTMVRAKELSQIYRYIADNKACGALMGDFNLKPDTELIADFSAQLEKLDWRDVTVNINETYHEYGKCSSKIDYIYTDLDCIQSYKVSDIENGVYCSDHYPICAVIRLP